MNTPIEIVRNGNSFPLTVYDIEDGHAYESEQGVIVIGNHIGAINGITLNHAISAFSIDGSSFFTRASATKFREVQMKVIINS